MNQLLQSKAKNHAAPVQVADLMTPNPSSIRDTASVWDAICFLTGKGFSAAPVVDDAGRPVGVLSRADIISHNRDMARHLRASQTSVPMVNCEADPTLVRVIMTPFVILAAPETPAEEAARQMVTCKVHRLFVVGDGGGLIGVLSALDLLRHFGATPRPDVFPLLDEE
jgi:CBS domain-containing protein